jgi:hypothetical protein
VVHDNRVVMRVVVRVVMMVVMHVVALVLVDDNRWFVPDDDRIGAHHGCECYKGSENKKYFHCHNHRLSRWNPSIPI